MSLSVSAMSMIADNKSWRSTDEIDVLAPKPSTRILGLDVSESSRSIATSSLMSSIIVETRSSPSWL